MKTLILLIFAAITTGEVSAQQSTSDTVYVVFTSIKNDGTGIYRHINNSYNKQYYRTPTHTYFIQNHTKDYLHMFDYLNRSDEPNNPIIVKSTSFLDTISYIDWDKVEPSLTAEQVESLFRKIAAYSKIYFIDRNDIKNGAIQLVPVLAPKPWH